MYKYKNLKRLIPYGRTTNCKLSERVQVYVDGSYSHKLKQGGFGIHIVDSSNNTIYNEFKSLSEYNLLKRTNPVTAELNGVLRALEICKSFGYLNIALIYDCITITEALQARRLNSDSVYTYRCLMELNLKHINIAFKHKRDLKNSMHKYAHNLSRTYISI